MTDEQSELLNRIAKALLGDEQLGEVGMAHKVDRMWIVFSALEWFGRAATWASVILAGVGAVVGGVIHFLKSPGR